MSWQRARNPEQKQMRREEILAAAADLFAERGVDVPLSDIAGSAGLSKAGLYRYFDSKEEVFLDLLLSDLTAFTADLERRLAPLAGSNDADAVAAAMVDAGSANPRLAALSSVLGSVLERNVDTETVAAFKSAAIGLSLRLVNALHAAMPAVDTGDLRDLFRYYVALSNGLWPQAHPSASVREVLERPEFAGLAVDFERDLRQAATCLLRGMLGGRAAG